MAANFSGTAQSWSACAETVRGEVRLDISWFCGILLLPGYRGNHTVSNDLTQAEKVGLKWPLPEPFDEAGLSLPAVLAETQGRCRIGQISTRWDNMRKEVNFCCPKAGVSTQFTDNEAAEYDLAGGVGRIS